MHCRSTNLEILVCVQNYSLVLKFEHTYSEFVVAVYETLVVSSIDEKRTHPQLGNWVTLKRFRDAGSFRHQKDYELPSSNSQ